MAVILNISCVRLIRQTAFELNQPVGILQDLQGPKIRLGQFETGSVVVSKGDDFTLTSRSVVGKQKISCVTYDLWQRSPLWINNSPDDGRVEMRVEQVDRVAKVALSHHCGRDAF